MSKKWVHRNQIFAHPGPSAKDRPQDWVEVDYDEQAGTAAAARTMFEMVNESGYPLKFAIYKRTDADKPRITVERDAPPHGEGEKTKCPRCGGDYPAGAVDMDWLRAEEMRRKNAEARAEKAEARAAELEHSIPTLGELLGCATNIEQQLTLYMRAYGLLRRLWSSGNAPSPSVCEEWRSLDMEINKKKEDGE